MITTGEFSFIHLHKSGGSFVAAFLTRFVPSTHLVGYHYPLRLLPESHRQLPVFGCVRNPWEVYVSYYWFQREVLERARTQVAERSASDLEAWIAHGNDPFNGVDVIFEELSEGGTLDFSETTRRILDVGSDDKDFERVFERLPREFDRRGRCTPAQASGFRGMNVRASDFAQLRNSRRGLYTFLFDHLFGGTDRVEYLRAERLRVELLDYLDGRGTRVTAPMQQFMQGADNVNTSVHSDYTDYYDSSLADLVEQRDGSLARRFGYTFELGGVPR